MNIRFLCLLLAFATCGIGKSYAQLTVAANGTAAALAANITGPGVLVSNAVIVCHNNAYGTFNGVASNVGIASGVLLTTGRANNALGPNDDDGTNGQDWGTTGTDADLIASVGATTYDECRLEFDLVPSCDSIGINYVFASEEYLEYVNAGVNDAFGFFLTGPNPSGPAYSAYNIARIPGTTTIVSIDNVNDVTNSAYYIDNGDGFFDCFFGSATCSNNHYIQYDGFTRPLIAKARVVPCQSYHMKLVIADVGDGLWDSGVFLTAAGITCVTPSGLQFTTSSTLNCTQPNAGTATVNVTAGTPPYTYLWSNGQTTPTATGLSAGTYKVVVRDNACFKDSVNVTLTSVGPVLNFSHTDAACFGGNTGTATVTATVGTPGYTYLWGGGQTTAAITGLTPATYDVSVTDSHGCITTGSVIVASPSQISVTANTTAATCGTNNGTATALATGGTPNYTYLWNTTPTQATTAAITGLAAGTYSVTATDSRGCSITNAGVLVGGPGNAVNLGATTTLCAGQTITLDAGNVGSTYLWSANAGSVTTQTFSPTITGTYGVTVTDGNGCTASGSRAITFAPLPIVALGNDVVTCVGTPVTIDAGNVGATYAWSVSAGSINTQTYSPTASGTYDVTVTDANNCSASDSKVVTFNPAPVVNLGAPVVVCSGTSVTLDAGNAGAAYVWSVNAASATTQTISPTASGTYAVTVTASTCSATGSVLVTINALPVVALGADVAVCIGTSVTVDAGNVGSTYLWSVNAASATTQTISPTTSGNYSVTVTDANTCSASDSKLVTFNPPPVVNLGNPVSVCAGTAVTLDAGNSGATYSWSVNAASATTQTINPTASGTYAVTVSVIGCTATGSVLVTFNTLPIVALGNDVAVCTGTAVTVDAGNPGATYLWSTNAASATTQTISPTVNGTYAVTVTDANSCSASDSKIVTFNPYPVVNLGSPISVCAGTAVTVDAGNPGDTYLWSANASSATTQTISPTISGTYSVTVTAPGTCTANGSVLVTYNALPIVALGNDVVVCTGTAVTVDAGNPGATYLWSANAASATTQTISPTTNGSYSVTVTDANTCSATDTKVVIFNPYPVVNLGNPVVVCIGTTVTLDAGNPGDTYLWSANANNATTQTVSPTASGTYTVTVTALGNCAVNGSVNVTINPLPIVALGNDVSVCTGVAVTLDAANAGSTYVWSTNASSATTQTISPTVDGTYAVTVTNANNCSASDNVLVTFNPIPVVNFGPDQNKCVGDVVTLDAGYAGSSYHWSNQQVTQTVTPTTTGTYAVTVTTPALCVGNGTININFTPLPTKELKDTSTCIGDTIVLDAGNAGATYAWANSSAITQTLTTATSGIYTVTITGANQCTVEASANISFHSPGSINIADASLCPGQQKALDATFAGAHYLWSTGGTAPILNVTQAGVYSVTLTINNHCIITDDVTIAAVNEVSIALIDSAICPDKQLVLDAGNPGANYVWSNGQLTQTITVKDEGVYGVSVTNECNTATAEMHLTNRDCNCYMYMPNIFSPNGDGVNDKFSAIRYCDSLQNFRLRVYDRWGEMIFDTNDPAIGWDGLFNGNPEKPDVYVWQMTYTSKEDDVWVDKTLHGSITLMR